MNQLPADANVCVYVMAKVASTEQIYTAQETFAVDKPDLDVKVRYKVIYILKPNYTTHLAYTTQRQFILNNTCESKLLIFKQILVVDSSKCG